MSVDSNDRRAMRIASLVPLVYIHGTSAYHELDPSLPKQDRDLVFSLVAEIRAASKKWETP